MNSDGHLTWPVRHSLIRYLGSLGDGRAVLSRGARSCPPDGVTFPIDKADNSTLAFVGEVRFLGHHGLLDIRISDPHLELSPTLCRLSLAPQRGRRTVVAECSIQIRFTDERWHVMGRNVRLTNEGSELFGRVYQPGEFLVSRE